MKDVPSEMLKRPLYLESSCSETFSLVLPRIDGSEFTSSTAASIAIFTILPVVVLKEKRAPIFTKSGLVELSMPAPVEENPLERTINTKSQTSIMVGGVAYRTIATNDHPALQTSEATSSNSFFFFKLFRKYEVQH